MGNSISWETAKRIESLQKRGLDCRGGLNCTRRARFEQLIQDERGRIFTIRFCAKHLPRGYQNATILETRIVKKEA